MTERPSVLSRITRAQQAYYARHGRKPVYLLMTVETLQNMMRQMWSLDFIPEKVCGLQLVIVPSDVLPPYGVVVVGTPSEEVLGMEARHVDTATDRATPWEH